MSFRRRLQFFFATMVVVPLLGVATVMFLLIGQSERSEMNARIGEGMQVASNLYDERVKRAKPVLREIAGDEGAGGDAVLSAALVDGRWRAARARMRELVGTDGLRAIQFSDEEGRVVTRAGSRDAVAAASALLGVAADGRRVGTLSVSVTGASTYARRVERLTDFELALFRRGRRLYSTVPGAPEPPSGGAAQPSLAFRVGDREYAGRLVTIGGRAGTSVQLAVFRDSSSLSNPSSGRRLAIGGILLISLLVALGLAGVVSRENVRLHEAIEEQATTDELTGIANLRELRSTLRREIVRARRFGHALGLVLLDVDDFKSVNDTHGHAHGSRVLAAVAGVLRRESRDIDLPARLGGDEFVVVLPEADADDAARVAERMRVALAALCVPGESGEGVVRVTGSFGVAAFPSDAHGDESLMDAADRARYRGKRAGKNRVERAGGQRIPQPTR